MSLPPGNYGDLGALDQVLPASGDVAAAASASFASLTQPPVIVWGAQGEPAAAMESFFITPDDSVQLTVWNSNATLLAVTFQLRVLRPDGSIVIETQTLNKLTADRTPNVFSVSQLEGLLVAAVIGPPGAAVGRGQTYVNLAIVRGTPANPIMSRVLCADYLTTALQPGWPLGRVLSAVEGSGFVRQVTGVVPSLGVFPMLAVPAGGRWRIRNCWVQLTTDGTAGNRQAVLYVEVPAQQSFQIGAGAVQLPNSAAIYSFAPGLPLASVQFAGVLAPIPPDLVLGVGGRLRMNAAGGAPGDQWTAITALIEEWIEV
jgi:hypothetical protein